MPRRSSRPRIPIRAMFPYVFRGSHIQPPGSKNPGIGSNETSVSGPANQAFAGLHKFPASTAGAVLHVRAGHRPAETSGRSTQTCASNRPHHLPCASGRSTQMRIRPTHSNSLRRRGGMAPLRDATTTGAPRSSSPEGRRLRPRAWIPEESGQVGLDKSPQVRRQGNRIRRTNDGSRRPDPASRWRLGSQSPLLYFITYFLKCLADFLQVVVRLFQ